MKSKIEKLEEITTELKMETLKMVYKAGRGHIGGSFSSANIIASLYFEIMNINPEEPDWEYRDRLILSKGHICPIVYAALAKLSYFDGKNLENFTKIDNFLQGHPDMRMTPGIDMTSGSLGIGLSIANGIGIASKLSGKKFYIYIIFGDGELQEGQVWEAALASSHYGLDNIIGFVDYNGLQLNGEVNKAINLEPLEDKFRSFGWQTYKIDGHNFEQILDTVNHAKEIRGKPKIIICRTIKGKGVSFMENNVNWHAKAPSKEEFHKAMSELSCEFNQRTENN
ncbi:MAG: transketolase [Actinobacteria bacterium]|nr:transketolase [Actinomycetota bacterium]